MIPIAIPIINLVEEKTKACENQGKGNRVALFEMQGKGKTFLEDEMKKYSQKS